MTFINRVILLLVAFIMNACLSEVETEDMTTPIPVKVVTPGEGWSGSSNIRAGTRQAYSIQAKFPKIGQYTVQFEIGNTPAPLGDDVFKATAEITWSVKGNGVRRLVNCANGMSVSGTAEAVSVKIIDASILDVNPPFDYVVGAQIAPGTRASVQQPPFLEDIKYTVLPGNTQDVLIPKDAGVISVYVATSVAVVGQSIASGAIKVEQLGGTLDLKAYDPRDGVWIPISPGADRLRLFVAGTGPVNGVKFTPVWGIDG